MIRALCTGVSRGLREADVIAVVRDVQGRNHFLQIEKDFLSQDNGHSYLPVALIHRDAQTESVLIELAHEAETGVNRIWVRASDVQGALKMQDTLTPAAAAPADRSSPCTPAVPPRIP
jgi:hypothetical protein